MIQGVIRYLMLLLGMGILKLVMGKEKYEAMEESEKKSLGLATFFGLVILLFIIGLIVSAYL